MNYKNAANVHCYKHCSWLNLILLLGLPMPLITTKYGMNSYKRHKIFFFD